MQDHIMREQKLLKDFSKSFKKDLKNYCQVMLVHQFKTNLHLKEFTLDEIEMIAEDNCKTAINQLLNVHKIEFENEKYYFVAQENFDFDIFSTVENIDKNLTFENAVKYFLQEYALKHCSKRTYETYFSIFKTHIIPYFKDIKLNEIKVGNIIEFYNNCQNRRIGTRRLKNTLTQLNQLIRYFQKLGIIDNKCTFQVKRITEKNKFSLNRIVFKENL